MDESDEEEGRQQEQEQERHHTGKKVVLKQRRNHPNAREGVKLTKMEALAVVLTFHRERQEGRGGGAGGPNSSAVGSELNKIFNEDKYCDKNYVACFRHLDENSIENSSSMWRNNAVEFGDFESYRYIIPTLFHNFSDFNFTWQDTSTRIRSRITETFGFTAETIEDASFNNPRFLQKRILLSEFNLACIRSEEALSQNGEIVDSDFLSPRGRKERHLVTWILCVLLYAME